MTQPKKTRGRPAGSRNQPRQQAEGQLTRCPSCQSTRREPYTQRTEQEHGGDQDGKPYTHIVRRWTRCADCGQARVDLHRENRPGPSPRGGSAEN